MINALQEDDGRFAFCSRETLEIIKALASEKINKLNTSVRDAVKYARPVEFKYAFGDTHVLFWFDRIEQVKPQI